MKAKIFIDKLFDYVLLIAVVFNATLSVPIFAEAREPTYEEAENHIIFYDGQGKSNNCQCTPSYGVARSSDIFMIGDSVTNTSILLLKQKMPDIQIITQDNKKISGTDDNNKSAAQIIKETNSGDLREKIVVALGTNSTITEQDIIDVIDAIGPNRTLTLVTNYSANDANTVINTNNNNIMKEVANNHTNVNIADWANAIGGDKDKYFDVSTSDINPTFDGQTLFAEIVLTALSGTATSDAVTAQNKLYNGNPILSDDSMQKIKEYRPFYEETARKYDIPWQIFAALHYREHSLAKSNPSNGQGVFQLYSYTNGGKNDKAFLPAGDITDEEFKRQLDIVGDLIKKNYMSGVNFTSDDGVKRFFYNYNGHSNVYEAQARDLGYSEEAAKNGEGSPYVMNLADKDRDSSVNTNWRQDKSDEESNYQLADQRPGAFLIYALLGGSTNSNCYCGGSYIPGSGNMNVNQTAIDLALPWTTQEAYQSTKTPTPAYAHALQVTGVNQLGDECSKAGNSCDAFVTTVMRYSGVDPDFKCCGVSNYGPTWQYVTTSGKYVEVEYKPENLKPGDILIYSNENKEKFGSGHIELYVEINGVGKIAAASHCSHTGAIRGYSYNSKYKVYRWAGN